MHLLARWFPSHGYRAKAKLTALLGLSTSEPDSDSHTVAPGLRVRVETAAGILVAQLDDIDELATVMDVKIIVAKAVPRARAPPNQQFLVSGYE